MLIDALKYTQQTKIAIIAMACCEICDEEVAYF